MTASKVLQRTTIFLCTNHQNQPLNKIYASLTTLHIGFSCTSVWDRDLKTSIKQPPINLKAKTILLIYTTSHPFVVTPPYFYQAHFTWQLPCHTVILCPTTTHTSHTEENNTKISMLSNTTTFPFSDLPCLHAIKSKHYQPPIEKTFFLEKP
jgi:hypothetical protein